MALSARMSPVVALVLCGAYVLLAAESFLAAYSVGSFTLSHFKIGPTELRILLAIGALAMWQHPTIRVGGRTWWMFDVAGTIAAAGMAATFLRAAVRNTRALAAAEPRPPALFGSARFPDLLRLEGDEGARQLIKRGHHVVTRPEELVDVDTRADLEELRALYGLPTDGK